MANPPVNSPDDLPPQSAHARLDRSLLVSHAITTCAAQQHTVAERKPLDDRADDICENPYSHELLPDFPWLCIVVNLSCLYQLRGNPASFARPETGQP